MKNIFLNTFWCLLFFITVSYGQDYSYRQYTLKDGLVQMQVQCLFQDSRGYIWVGTKGGVSKFNGETFENFRQKDGLLHPFIYDIAEDSKGNIWFASPKGLTKYNGQELINFPLGDSIPDGRILGIIIDKKDNIWINRYRVGEQHTLKFDGEHFTVIKTKWKTKSFLTYGIEYDVTTNKLLIPLKGEGIGQIDGDTIIPYISRSFDGADIYFNQQLNQIKYAEVIKDFSQAFVIKNDSLHPLWKYDRKANQYYDVNYSILPKDYYYFKNGQFICFRKEQKKIEYIQQVTFNAIKTFIIDKENTIWIGSEEGLIQFFGEKGFQHYGAEHFQYVWNLVEDKTEKLWFCGFNTKLKTYHQGKITELSDYENTKGIYKEKWFYYGALNDEKDNLLFPMHKNIMRYDGKEYSIIKSNGVSNAVNLQLWEDKEKGFVIAGVQGGINILKNYIVIDSFFEKDGIHPCSYIISIGKDRNEDYWLGSFQGLSKLNLKTKKIQNYTKKNKKLPSDGVISITKDSRNNMWFGSRNGLLTYDYEKDSIFNISPDLNQDISFLFLIDDDHLMLGAVSGLYVLDLASYYNNGKVIYKHFNHRNGYLGIEPTQNTFLKDSKGKIWVASSTSVDKFDPQTLDLSIPTINTRITHINREKVAYNINDYNLSKGKNALEFRFEGIGFERPLHTQYAYLLEGHNEDWSEWRKEDFAVYNNLGSGNYRFKVKSRMGSYADVKPTIATIDIKVDLPFWKEPDFYQTALYVVPFILGLLISFYWKTRQNRKLTEKNSQIEFLNKELSHRVKNNLQFISSLINLQARRLEDGDAKTALTESRNRLQVMSSLHRRLYRRNDTNIEIGGFLKELTAQLRRSYTTQYNNLIIEVDVKEKLELDGEMVGKIGLIINELVMNSIKHAFENQPNPQINIQISSTDKNGLCLIIKDNGTGLTEKLDLKKSNSLGMKLVFNLVKQLRGEINFKNNNGLAYELFLTPNKINS